jgi:malate synthase
VRGDKVIAFARAFLDEAAPLAPAPRRLHRLQRSNNGKLAVTLKGGSNTGLRDAAQLIGFQGEAAQPPPCC